MIEQSPSSCRLVQFRLLWPVPDRSLICRQPIADEMQNDGQRCNNWSLTDGRLVSDESVTYQRRKTVAMVAEVAINDANPHAQVFGPPEPPSPSPEAWPRSQNENYSWYVLCLLFVRTQTKFGVKIFGIDSLNEISWYLTFWPHPKVTSWP